MIFTQCVLRSKLTRNQTIVHYAQIIKLSVFLLLFSPAFLLFRNSYVISDNEHIRGISL